jgi:L,D-peptidoglycan transpeptidase YkuD (ErfK/YbiS/YcfS/YnhG family)
MGRPRDAETAGRVSEGKDSCHIYDPISVDGFMRRKVESGTFMRPRRRITLISSPGERHRGRLVCGNLVLSCAIGRSGVAHLKREGDGATPAGRLRLTGICWRADRLLRPPTALPVRAMRKNDGWCEAPRHGSYNRSIRLPSAAGHETMWRDDNLYDIVGVFDWNATPRVSYRGSAIFLHLCRPGLAPTAGCIALRLGDLRRLLAAAGPHPEFWVKQMSRPVKGRRPHESMARRFIVAGGGEASYRPFAREKANGRNNKGGLECDRWHLRSGFC